MRTPKQKDGHKDIYQAATDIIDQSWIQTGLNHEALSQSKLFADLFDQLTASGRPVKSLLAEWQSKPVSEILNKEAVIAGLGFARDLLVRVITNHPIPQKLLVNIRTALSKLESMLGRHSELLKPEELSSVVVILNDVVSKLAAGDMARRIEQAEKAVGLSCVILLREKDQRMQFRPMFIDTDMLILGLNEGEPGVWIGRLEHEFVAFSQMQKAEIIYSWTYAYDPKHIRGRYGPLARLLRLSGRKYQQKPLL